MSDDALNAALDAALEKAMRRAIDRGDRVAMDRLGRVIDLRDPNWQAHLARQAAAAAEEASS